jgi:hypothetical protein
MTIDTSNLLTQVNADIAAVTSGTSEADLIALSVMANKLGATRTVLDAEIQTRITNLTGAEATKTNLTLAVASSAGAGGILKPVAFASAPIAAGSSGDILTATAGTGQCFKLTYLLTDGTAGGEAGITLSIDGNDIFTNQELTDETPTGYGIARFFTSPSTNGRISSTDKLLTDEYCKTFTLTKVAGSTARAINYAYVTLEAL